MYADMTYVSGLQRGWRSPSVPGWRRTSVSATVGHLFVILAGSDFLSELKTDQRLSRTTNEVSHEIWRLTPMMYDGRRGRSKGGMRKKTKTPVSHEMRIQ